MKIRLSEGLRPNDLQGMMSNVVSVDEYESKIDDSALVIGFMINDRHAAADANRFIQKSYVDILDSEVSAAPDMNGNYLVFVEIPMNDKAARSIAQLCGDLTSLGGFTEWKIRVRGHDETEAMSSDRIEHVIRGLLQENVKQFFKESCTSFDIVGENYRLLLGNYLLNVSVQDLGPTERVVYANRLAEEAIDLSIEGQRMCRMVKAVLGEGYSVEKLGRHLVIADHRADRMILLTT